MTGRFYFGMMKAAPAAPLGGICGGCRTLLRGKSPRGGGAIERVNILFFGDVVGLEAVKAIAAELPELKQRYAVDFVVANGENVAGGLGITSALAQRLYEAGVDVLTMGNHVWSKHELLKTIDQETRLIRPANGLPDWPGRGCACYPVKGLRLAVINLVGQVYMGPAQSPFCVAEQLLAELKRERVRHILIDFHAEASAEKMALAHSLVGRVGAVLGTHTHVQTADERILGDYTAYITDVGMCGPQDSIIGMQIESSIRRMAQQLPVRYCLAEGPVSLQGVVLGLDDATGACRRLTRFTTPPRDY